MRNLPRNGLQAFRISPLFGSTNLSSYGIPFPAFSTGNLTANSY
jgi:hypothetical protein